LGPLMIPQTTFEHTGKVKKFPQTDGWYYVGIPNNITDPLKIYADRGLVAITAQVGAFSWKTSLLPKGDGTLFIALNKKVRDHQKIKLNDTISIKFQLRER